MPNESEFSIEKKDLRPDEFEKYLEGSNIRASIKRNVEQALGADIVRRKEGIFAFDDYAKSFTFDGSLKSTKDPRESNTYGKFFEAGGRLTQKGDFYIFRGPNYLVSIDPTLEVRQKLDKLEADFIDAIDVLSMEGGNISGEEYIEQSATLDYLKNSAITVFNALIQEEKIGKFYLLDAEYQKIRQYAVDLARHSTQAYYSHLIGRSEDYSQAMTKLVDEHERMLEVVDYIENEYREGVFSSRHFTRPEAGHPLVIAASTFTAVREVKPVPDTIIGLPSGGTELAFAQQYAYHTLLEHHTDFTLIPLSLHSIKDAFGKEDIEPERSGFLDFLRSRENLLNGKNILIVEDNSSTGRTIQQLHDMLKELYGPQTVNVSVAEADLIRSTINSEAAHRTHVASDKVYTYSVGILPISRKLHPKTDLKEIAETHRLAWEYRKKFESATTEAEKTLYEAYIQMCLHPTEDILDKLNDQNSIRFFRGTFLSNFYGAPVSYNGQQFPSVEHAYQAQKFTPEILSGVSEACMDDINEILRIRGRAEPMQDATTIFTDRTLFSGVIKAIADSLREHAYVRQGWDADKMLLMADLLLQKFEDPNLAERLLATEDIYLVEGNTWNDTLWGVSEGRGRNLLGLMLMEIRRNLRGKGKNA